MGLFKQFLIESTRDSKIYIKKYKTINGIDIWFVDGNYVRTNLSEEFTNTGHHYRFKFIPKNEYWLDNEAVKNETNIFIYELQKEVELWKKHKSFPKSLEQDFRKKEKNGINNKDVYKSLWKQYGNVKVWIVDGKKVRGLHYAYFTEGGHGYVYKWIPKDEIWLDDDLFENERKFVLVHESHERNLMKNQHLSYDHAHKLSSALELKCRRGQRDAWQEIKKNII